MSAYRSEQVVVSRLPPEKGPYQELCALAEAFEAPYAGAPKLEADVEGMPVVIELILNSGQVEGATIQVSGRTWPSISFRRENDEMGEAKRTGLVREVQTGDAEFDAEVFIEFDGPDAVVLRILDDAKRRRSIRDLLRWSAVTLGDDGIHLSVRDKDAFDPAWLRKHLFAPLRALYEGPALAYEQWRGPHDRLIGALGVLACISFLVAVIVGGLLIFDLQRFALAMVGTLLGLLLIVPTWFLTRTIIRGHSRSLEQFQMAIGCLALTYVCWGASVPMLLNALVDAGRREVKGVVIELQPVGDGEVRAHVRWEDGSVAQWYPPPEVRVGARVHMTLRRGLFGWRWEQTTNIELDGAQ